uniref:TSC22 domain family protein 1 n=1 Tax=Loa loa TaxID=7209 RepID=A0A1I7VEV2_LOALO
MSNLLWERKVLLEEYPGISDIGCNMKQLAVLNTISKLCKFLIPKILPKNLHTISCGLIVASDRWYFHFSSPAGETVVAASGTGASTPIIAIDGKIEQAMDLVKTHLMFAVREEVDVLRAKIMELEATILQLETENAILREHVPVEILNKLSLQSTPPNSSTTTTAV